MFVLFEYSPFTLSFITFIGSGTAFFAATTGLFQNDMKKSYCILTCSQLGYMILHVGYLVMKWVFFIYQTMHFSKLYYFRCWFWIHAVADEQDMRKMGGLKIYCPFLTV
jgi:NADH-quinone oxidoreductase subunit L